MSGDVPVSSPSSSSGWDEDVMADTEAAILDIAIRAGTWYINGIGHMGVPAAMEPTGPTHGLPSSGLKRRED